MSQITSSGVTLISQGTGYGLLIGLGILFCGVILIAVKIQKAYLDEDSGKSEMFMVANRTVGTGLTASAVFSSWMWINETVFSAVNCYRFGLAAPMIALMAVLGVLAKLRVPYAHTSLEIIRMRYGKIAHVATFLTDYLHTAIALILIIYFTMAILTHEAIGGLYGLYDKVTAISDENYIPGNYKGHCILAKKSFATEVKATVPGYNLAAIAIFGVPWGLGTVIGLAARVLHDTPLFPTYPGEFTQQEVLTGFVMPYTIQAIIGEKGVVAFFVLLFMALTSTVSSSMIAVSSILSFDVYKTYINPTASDKRIIRVSHLSVVFHGVFITAFSIILNYGGANMTWIGYFRPILTSSGIIPLIFTLTWAGQTRLAATWAPILGFISGLTIWLATAKSMYGTINLATTMKEAPCLFDWRQFLRIELVETPDSDDTISSTATDQNIPEKQPVTSSSSSTTDTIHQSDSNSNNTEVNNLDDLRHPFDGDTLNQLRRWYRIAWLMWAVLVLLTFVVWPMPLYRDYIFNKPFFAGWTIVAIVWQFLAFVSVVVYPIYDGRYEIWTAAKGVTKTIRLKGLIAAGFVRT
ncbi:sodium:solute symporter family protein [Aspergillus tanneri]|uniref:Urea active transporter n=1 Tax=Aspergillus tanneri TaxID=1220188 RepID=A0A5M9MFM9_9EURO|nr:uncharacterized protein ATNIH1004_007202 [Aspergillus tanneri]KAA8645782.1 hypothetical protein ATNIH1004_007202 [Aspergillus tanneri]